MIVSDPQTSIDLYMKVFNAEISEETENQGKLVHAALKIGTSLLYLGE